MPFVPRALYEEMVSVLRAVRTGELIRAPEIVAAPPAEMAAPERELHLVTNRPDPNAPIDWMTAPLPSDIEWECQTRGAGEREHLLNMVTARKQLAMGIGPADVLQNIRFARHA